jgi:protein-S-isoprenylcysteine O-methyltransferase Ste14
VVGPFLAAGTPRWTAGWVYLGVVVSCALAHGIFVRRRNPELMRRRKRLGAGTKRWDLAWNLLFWPLMIAVPVIAGLGARLGWPALPLPLWALGPILVGGGFALSAWAMSVNPHFEGTVRIQTDRDHRVIDVGPYRGVRHPGYVGLCLLAAGSPFLLLSRAALVPAGVVVGWIVLRTALEDALLRRELVGYAEFARRTRYRLLPGIW